MSTVTLRDSRTVYLMFHSYSRDWMITLQPDVQLWLEDNVIPQSYRWNPVLVGTSLEPKVIDLWFDRDEDAVLFKLAWLCDPA